MKLTFSVFLLFPILLTSCNYPTSGTNDRTLIINPSEIVGKESGIFEIEKLISLESNDESLFSDVYHCEISRNRIYVYDDLKSKSIVIFDMDGNHIRTFKNKGLGPGELGHIKNFSVNRDDESINILDQSRHSIMVYDSAGVFVKEVNHGCSMVTGVVMDDDQNYYLGVSSSSRVYINGKIIDSNLIYLNAQNKRVRGCLPFKGVDGYYSIFSYGDLFRSYEGDIFFKRSLDWCIYRIEDGDVKHYLDFDFGKYNMDSSFLQMNYMNRSFSNFNANKSGYVYRIRKFFVLEEYFFLTYFKDGKIFCCLVKRKDLSVVYNNTLRNLNNQEFGFSVGGVCANTPRGLVVYLEPETTIYSQKDPNKYDRKKVSYKTTDPILAIINVN